MMRDARRFARGSGVYACRYCERKTRATGLGDNENAGLCAECYELGGEENSLSDTGALYGTPENVLATIDAITKRGGKAGCWDSLKATATVALAEKNADAVAKAAGKALDAAYPFGYRGA